MGFKLNIKMVLNAETLEAFLFPSVNVQYHHHPDPFISGSGNTNKDITVQNEMNSFTDITVIK